MQYEFLSPYSPDFNPMEEGFSKMKSVIRRNGEAFRKAMTNNDTPRLYQLLLNAIFSITAADCRGYFTDSGYS
jgi:transposase